MFYFKLLRYFQFPHFGYIYYFQFYITVFYLILNKNTTHPVNGVQIAAPIILQSTASASDRNPQPTKNLNEVVSVITSMEEVGVSTGIELGSECMELRGGKSVRDSKEVSSSVENPVLKSEVSFLNQHVMAIPEMSYSSSEDEDFFDASENMAQSPTLVT